MTRLLMISFKAPIFAMAFSTTVLAVAVAGQEAPDQNLSRVSRVSASSESENTRPENLIDGDITGTYWTPKEGTLLADTWVELNWSSPVRFQEVVVRQKDLAGLSRLALETRDVEGTWHPLSTLVDIRQLLPRLILMQFPTQSTRGLRLSGFAGSVSLTEIEVYEKAHPPTIGVASDLLNHIIGMVTDGVGTRPIANVPVRVNGAVAGKPWKASAHTDENGMFRIDMPVGLEGDLTASAQLANGESPHITVHADSLAPGLSMPDSTLSAVNLNGNWRFKPDPESEFYRTDFFDREWKRIRVPSHWMMEGFQSEKGIGGYRRHVEIPESFRNRRIKLLFDGVYSGAEVWWNGQRVGSHEGGFTPFEVDVTKVANLGGDNLLAVMVREDTLSSHLDNMSLYANFPLTGIFRKVTLFAVPSEHVRRFHVQTTFDPAYRDATMIVDLTVENESRKETNDAILEFSLKNPNGLVVPLTNNRLSLRLTPWSRLERRLEFHVEQPEHWEAEHPRLYTLSAHLANPQGVDEVVSRRVGFRQVEIRGTELLINGTPVKLRGANHYDFHPLLGRAVTPELTRQDLQMMKEANLDAIRTPTFPAVPELYDYADEMGSFPVIRSGRENDGECDPHIPRSASLTTVPQPRADDWRFQLTASGIRRWVLGCLFKARLRRDLGNVVPANGFKPLVARNDDEDRQPPESPPPYPAPAIESPAVQEHPSPVPDEFGNAGNTGYRTSEGDGEKIRSAPRRGRGTRGVWSR